ncbi:MAG: long-chain fatty acid--CoA ligase [Verrucomicrobiae bacterium]|nr:long-chain fatty acid--CoA ligase [Verrucomicrobiae bacterium]
MAETENARSGGGGDLYAAWKSARDAAGADSWALSDLKTGRHWTFGDIQATVDSLAPCDSGDIRFPVGYSVDLVFETLRAWRDGALLCPVESEGSEPDATVFEGLPDETVHVKITSGSTGRPRLVRFLGPDLAADARKIVATMGLRSEWPNLGVISMAHSYGFSSLVLPLLLHGIPLAWLGDPLPGAVGAALTGSLKQGTGWTLPAVPAMWRAWLVAGVLSGDDLRLAISAGAPLPLELGHAVFDSTGMKIHNFLGSSECGGIAYDRSAVPRTSAESAGSAMEETSLVVNAEGCLEVHSPSVAAGYWPPEPEGAIGDGVFYTSDLAEIDPDSGEVKLQGRRDDLINVAGRKVSPVRVESALAKHPEIACVLVFGVPSADAARGDDIVAVYTGVGQTGDEEKLRRFAAETLAAHEIPRHWWPCPEVAPDARGKLSRTRWRERFLRERQGRT